MFGELIEVGCVDQGPVVIECIVLMESNQQLVFADCFVLVSPGQGGRGDDEIVGGVMMYNYHGL